MSPVFAVSYVSGTTLAITDTYVPPARATQRQRLVARGSERLDGSIKQGAACRSNGECCSWIFPGVGNHRLRRIRGHIPCLAREIRNNVDTLAAHGSGAPDGLFER